MDDSAPTSMKNAANCETLCDLQNSWIIEFLNASGARGLIPRAGLFECPIFGVKYIKNFVLSACKKAPGVQLMGASLALLLGSPEIFIFNDLKLIYMNWNPRYHSMEKSTFGADDGSVLLWVHMMVVESKYFFDNSSWLWAWHVEVWKSHWETACRLRNGYRFV